LQTLREEKNDAATSRRAERDLERLQSAMPSLDKKGREELERLKKEFERLRQ
jgi:hypothetical protein